MFVHAIIPSKIYGYMRGILSYHVFVNKKVLQKGVKKVSTFNTQ